MKHSFWAYAGGALRTGFVIAAAQFALPQLSAAQAVFGPSTPSVPAATNTVVVRAKSNLAANAGPLMKLRVNGTEVGSVEVRASTYTNYSFNFAVPSGAKVDVVFDNDFRDKSGDRNLYVESITVNGATIAATAPGVVFDRGPGVQAFDGLDVLPGLSTLWWNGALRFTAGAAPAPVPTSSGPCGYAPAGTQCKFDAIAYYSPDRNNFTEETVIAYGKLWVFDAQGNPKINGTNLRSVPRYASGPCALAPQGETCKIDSLTILDYPGIGYIESVSAYGKYFNFDRNGNQYAGASNADLRSVARYASSGPVIGPTIMPPCNLFPAGQNCVFDTRTLVDAPEWGGVIESITTNSRYFLYDASSTLVQSAPLTSVARYYNAGPVIGPSIGGPCNPAPAGTGCKFDSLDFKRVNGQLVEVLTAYGRYWEFAVGSDTPRAGGEGQLLSSIPRFVGSATPPPPPPPTSKSGPCGAVPAGTQCKFDAIAYYSPDRSNFTEETVIAYGKLWVFDAQGNPKVNGTNLRSVPRYANGPCALAPQSETCKIDSLSIINYPGIGYIESVSAYGKYFNFDRNGNQYAGASNADLRSVERYYTSGPSFGGSIIKPCAFFPAGQSCVFDTRTVLDAPEWGGVIESITTNSRYFLYDASSTLVQSAALASVARYYVTGPVIGPSIGGPCNPAPAGSACKFDSVDFKRVNGQLVEVITAYGRYWEFTAGSDTPRAGGEGQQLSGIARFVGK